MHLLNYFMFFWTRVNTLLLPAVAVLVAVTVWNQKGSENKFRKRGVYHIPAEHESWEDIRENILNYNEEGGGEQDQVRCKQSTGTDDVLMKRLMQQACF